MAELSQNQKDFIANQILNVPDLKNAGVRFVNKDATENIVQASGVPKIWVCLKNENLQHNTTVAEPQHNVLSKEKRDIESSPSLIVKHIKSVGANCGLAALSGITSGALTAAAIPTGGASAPLAWISWTGTVTSAVSCGISVGKAINDAIEPNALNNSLDSTESFVATEKFLEGVSDVAGIISIGAAVKNLVTISQAAKKPIWQMFKGLSNSEKRQVAKELAKSEGKATSNNNWKELVKSGKLPGKLTQSEISKRIQMPLMETVGNAFSIIYNQASGHAVSSKFIVYIVFEE